LPLARTGAQLARTHPHNREGDEGAGLLRL